MSRTSSGVAVVAHGGGPTRVINASMVGVIEECRRHREIVGLYGACHGLTGILEEKFIDLFRQKKKTLSAVKEGTSSALGSSRKEMTSPDLERLLAIFRAHKVRYLFLTGGNGTMGTAHRISGVAHDRGYELRVVGIPKTIDNDLTETDHSPGYASTARFFACALRDIGADNRALPTPISVVEVMGRNAGWLAAATCLARHEPDDAPHLIYFPERRISSEQIVEDVHGVYRRLGRAVITVCEGQLDETGNPFGADVRIGSRHSLALNLGHVVSQIISKQLKIPARSEKPGLLGRSSTACASAVDLREAYQCGAAAVRAAIAGEDGKMVTLIRVRGASYRARTGLVELERVANKERPLPATWINASGNDVQPEFQKYAAPLIGEITPIPRLEPIFVRERKKGQREAEFRAKSAG